MKSVSVLLRQDFGHLSHARPPLSIKDGTNKPLWLRQGGGVTKNV
jgi:hypothetical protein